MKTEERCIKDLITYKNQFQELKAYLGRFRLKELTMVSSRSQASCWYLHVHAVEAGPSRIPFQYPCLCYLLTWVSLLSSQMLQIYMAISSLHSPYSHRFPCWPRSIRKLTFVCLFSGELIWGKTGGALIGCLLLCTVILLWHFTIFLMGKETRQIFLCSLFLTVPAVSVLEPNIQPD